MAKEKVYPREEVVKNLYWVKMVEIVSWMEIYSQEKVAGLSNEKINIKYTE